MSKEKLSLTVPITISTLDDGIYKIKGQFIIGGNSTTVHSSADEVFFLVSHDEDTHGTSITQFKGKGKREEKNEEWEVIA